MSYLVLARKYRPKTFSEMVGQEHVVQALTNALTQQRLHHAYLFTGTRGVGKTTVSRILAKSLNCTGADGQGGITAQPCGVCAACRDIDAGRYVDYIELDAASNRGVDEISQLLDQAVYKPVVGRFKVYMIDEVHMLTTTAFNAMLKTLEEPPEYLKFVLATTDPQKVPVTVLSRCLQFNLRPMAPETVYEHLQTVLAAEAIEAELPALRLLAQAARGSMRDALSLTDQAIAFGGGRLEEGAIRQMLGAVDRSHVTRILEAVAAADGVALVNTVGELRGLGLSAAGTLEELATLVQQLAVLQAVPQAANPNDPDLPLLQHLAALLSSQEVQLVYSVAVHGRAELPLAPDEYSGLTMVLLRLLAFKPFGGAPRSPRAPGEGVASPGTGPAARVAASTAAAAPAVAPAAAAALRPAPSPSQPLRRPEAASVAVPVPPVLAQPARTTAAPEPATVPVTLPVTLPVVAARASSGSEPSHGSSVPPWEDDDAGLMAEPPSAPAGRPEPPPELEPESPAAALRRSPSSGIELRPEAERPAPLPVSAAEQACTDRWVECCRQLFERQALHGLVREAAWQAQCVQIDETAQPPRWTLRLERESLRQPGHRDRLQEALSNLLGQPVQLELLAGAVGDSAARREAAARARAQALAEEEIRQDPLVLELLARYPGSRIVPGSIRPV